MRDGRRRLPLIVLGALGALLALIFVGNYIYYSSGSLFGFGESPVVKVSLKASDLPAGMTQCAVHGRPQGKGGAMHFDGQTDEWTVVYADSANACNLPPAGRYVFSWVVEFNSLSAAVAAYRAFVGSQDCTLAHGCVDWGLGQNSTLACGNSQGAGSCLGTWQRNAFLLTFDGVMGIDEARKAVTDMDARAHQIQAQASA